MASQHALQAGGQWVAGNEWPLDAPVHIVMPRKEQGASAVQWVIVEVDYTDPTKMPVVDLSQQLPSGNSGLGRWQSSVVTLAADQNPPAHGLYAVIERQPTKTSGPERRVDPLDLNMPARLAFHINDADGGFVGFAPKAGSHPLVQMMEAPESGYMPELVLSEKRLKSLRDPAGNLVPNRNEFFYFRANGKYGKGVVSWAHTTDETGPLRLFMALMMQPDGSRTLTTRGVP